MKKITLVLSLIASAFLVTSCASNTPAADQPTVTSDNSTVVSHHGKNRHHHDFKGEMK